MSSNDITGTRSECPQRRPQVLADLGQSNDRLRGGRSTTWRARCLVAMYCSLLQRIQLRQSIGTKFMRLEIVLVLGYGPRVTGIAGAVSFRPIGSALVLGALGLVRIGVLSDGAVRGGDAHLVDASPFEISALLRHSSRHVISTGSGWYRYRRHHHHASLVCSRLTTSSYDHS